MHLAQILVTLHFSVTLLRLKELGKLSVLLFKQRKTVCHGLTLLHLPEVAADDDYLQIVVPGWRSSTVPSPLHIQLLAVLIEHPLRILHIFEHDVTTVQR